MTTEVEEKFQSRKSLFIEKIGELLSYYEWGNQLIMQAEEECGFQKGYNLILFPEGINQVLEIFEQSQDLQMIKLLDALTPPVKIREKIAMALKIRIKDCSAKPIMKKNYNYLVRNPDLVLSSKIAWQTCDYIWRYAGDRSIDFNYYSKRLLLTGVYIPSILFYLNDESQDANKTDNFIDALLAKVINMASIKNLCKLPKIEDIPILRLFS